MKLQKITASLVRSLILPRKKDSHKGDFGHVLIVAGSRNMTGAAVLCANAALTSGAGLVTAAVSKSARVIVSKKILPEAMILPLAENSRGQINSKALNGILDFIARRKVTCVVLGPGLGQGKGVTKLVGRLVSTVTLPLVLDADGLNAIKIRDLKKASAKIIVTPHPGEMARLIGSEIREVQGSRARTALEFSRETGVVCVLKGAGTVVTDGKNIFQNTTGNPGMAKGGSGDVLGGVIAALTCQVKAPELLNSALCAVFLHGLAGDIAAKEKTEIGLLAGDISRTIPRALKRTLKPL